MKKLRFRLSIEYDGTDYSGWQVQNGQVTVQGEIEEALTRIFGYHVRITAAGRTDSGVHARAQVAHLDLNDEPDTGRLLRSLNGVLHRDIRVKSIDSVDQVFHARYDAVLREYIYKISAQPTALMRRFVWQLYYQLDLEKMNAAATIILGKHDFASFCRTKSDVENHICNIELASWYEQDGLLLFCIRADRFLHGMVRALVGTMVDLGRGRIDTTEFRNILAAGDRRSAGPAAPARGLTLEKIFYSKSI